MRLPPPPDLSAAPMLRATCNSITCALVTCTIVTCRVGGSAAVLPLFCRCSAAVLPLTASLRTNADAEADAHYSCVAGAVEGAQGARGGGAGAEEEGGGGGEEEEEAQDAIRASGGRLGASRTSFPLPRPPAGNASDCRHAQKAEGEVGKEQQQRQAGRQAGRSEHLRREEQVQENARSVRWRPLRQASAVCSAAPAQAQPKGSQR